MSTFVKLMIFVVITIKSLKESLCFPVNLRINQRGGHDGTKVIISNMAEQRSLLNHTVPAALLSHLSPPEYLKEKRLNMTADRRDQHDKPSSFLSVLLSSQENLYSAQQRQVGTSCPVQWVVDFEANRIPTSIQKAVCNLQGTTCLSIQGWPSCEEFSVQWKIQRFLGITQEGHQVWQEQYQSFPIACTCPGLK